MLAWVNAGTALAERFEGFLGAGWVRSSAHGREWHMLYGFTDEARLRVGAGPGTIVVAGHLLGAVVIGDRLPVTRYR